MLKVNMQLESGYNIRLLGGGSEDSRQLGFQDAGIILSRTFPGAAQADSTSPVAAGGATDGISDSSAGTLTGTIPTISNGGTQSMSSTSVAASPTLSSTNHLATPSTVTATDVGTGIGPSGYLMTVAWANAASYGPATFMCVFNRSGDTLLGIGLAASGSTIIDGLSNIAYTVYCKSTFDGVHFSSASNTASATPTGNSVNLPSAASVLLGVPVGGTTGTLDVGGSVMSEVVEGTLTMQQAMKIMAAVLAGKTTITSSGSGAATVVFRDTTDSKNRVSTTMTGSSRTAIATDLS